MDTLRFARSYDQLPEKIPPSNPERRELLEAPREWMRFFDELLTSHLMGETPPDQNDLIPKLGRYFAWNMVHLRPIIDRARAIDDPAEKNDIASEFIFHQINGPLTFAWAELLYKKQGIDGMTNQVLTDMQTNLAIKMTPSVQRLIKIQNEDRTLRGMKEQSALKGVLSEADATVASLEAIKSNENLIVLPATDRYERNFHPVNRNADLLLIDTNNSLIRGMQIKTDTVDGAGGHTEYDNTYVTVIDSAHELGNTAFTDKNKRRQLALPGQLAMGLLAERPARPPALSGVGLPEYMRTRQIARELSRGHKSFLSQAAGHIAHRVIPELGRSAQAEITDINPEQDTSPEHKIA